MRGAWTGRFALALGLALVTATTTAGLVWQVTSPRPPQALPEGEPVVLEHWTIVNRGLDVVPELEGPESDEPVRPSPGAVIGLLAFDLTYTDPATLYETVCAVTFRTRDGRTEWPTNNSAVIDAYGFDDHTCGMSPATEDEPAEVELGETVRITYSVEVPVDLADELVAEVALGGTLDQGAQLRWRTGQVASYLID